jgi:hypothetical protein
MDRLEVNVAAAQRRAKWIDKREVTFFVNGRPLVELLGGGDLGGLTPAELPPSGHLLGQPDENLCIHGRTALLICPECGDVGCTTALARVHITPDAVTWTDFVLASTGAPEGRPIPCTFSFGRTNYERALAEAAHADAESPKSRVPRSGSSGGIVGRIRPSQSILRRLLGIGYTCGGATSRCGPLRSRRAQRMDRSAGRGVG